MIHSPNTKHKTHIVYDEAARLDDFPAFWTTLQPRHDPRFTVIHSTISQSDLTDLLDSVSGEPTGMLVSTPSILDRFISLIDPRIPDKTVIVGPMSPFRRHTLADWTTILRHRLE